MIVSNKNLAEPEQTNYPSSYETTWKTFLREKRYVDTRELQIVKKEREVRERLADIEERERQILAKQAEADRQLGDLKAKAIQFDSKLLGLLSAFSGPETRQVVMGVKRARDLRDAAILAESERAMGKKPKLNETGSGTPETPTPSANRSSTAHVTPAIKHP